MTDISPAGRSMTSDLLARLQRHYIKPGDLMPGGAFLPEVTLEGRRADALYVGFFQSRGKFLVGHELKVSRADWMHELDQPAKAETWHQHCHEWYLVVPSREIVHDGELPTGWGLMVPNPRTKTRMDVIVKSAHQATAQPSWAATHAIVQRMDSLRIDGILDARTKAQQAAWTNVEEQVAARLKVSPAERDRERADRAEALLAQVGDILGMRVAENGYDWRTDSVSIEMLRASFARWLKSDKVIANALNRTDGITRARELLTEVESTLQSLREEVTTS